MARLTWIWFIVVILVALLAVSRAGDQEHATHGRSKRCQAIQNNKSCATSAVLNRPLSKVEALNIAIANNGAILQAQDDVEAAFGVAIQTKAIIFPHVSGTGGYEAREDSLIEENQNRELPSKRITLPPLGPLVVTDTNGNPIGQVTSPAPRQIDVGGGTRPKVNNQVWGAEIRVVQSIYEGGRLLSAVRASRLIREQALLTYESVVADTLLAVSTAYDDVLSSKKQLEVRQESVNLLTEFLKNTKIRGNVGDVPPFEVLRAEVELANEQASFVQGVGNYRVAKQVFVERLGINLPTTVSDDLALNLTTPLETQPYHNDLASALASALIKRTEIEALEKEKLLRNEEVIVALAGYKPSVQAFGGYRVTSRAQTRNAGEEVHGGVVGGLVSWSIFDGFLTKGRVDEAVARRSRAGDAQAETIRMVQLQVRTAWSDLRSARAVLDAQSKNVDKAVEALRLVEARYNEGVATQVAVLDAQTALTGARASYVQGQRDYSVARARLLRATGEDLQRPW